MTDTPRATRKRSRTERETDTMTATNKIFEVAEANGWKRSASIVKAEERGGRWPEAFDLPSFVFTFERAGVRLTMPATPHKRYAEDEARDNIRKVNDLKDWRWLRGNSRLGYFGVVGGVRFATLEEFEAVLTDKPGNVPAPKTPPAEAKPARAAVKKAPATKAARKPASKATPKRTATKAKATTPRRRTAATAA